MNGLLVYLYSVIRPRGPHEFSVSERFDIDIFHKMVEDGLYITQEVPPSTIDRSTIEYVQFGNHFLCKKIKTGLVWLKADGSKSFDDSREPIYRRLIPPPYETVDHVHILRCVASMIGPPNEISYVEYGVSYGHSLNGVANLIGSGIGVDIGPKPENITQEHIKFYNMTTDEFSAGILPSVKFNLAFVDADHCFTSAYTDFTHVYDKIENGGYILLHDTYPCVEYLLEPRFCNDCYKVPFEIKKNYPNAEIITIPLNPGVTIVRKNEKD